MTIAEQLKQKGIQLGEQRGIEKVARNMLLDGMDRSTVMRMTGLTEEQLSRIKH
ncbi:putative transposase/invertase (TIGR01784 family) [Pantoea cypripedii]|nr:putative transposase/invertase (TIGR01784 family) [Pantoea cypripedii]